MQTDKSVKKSVSFPPDLLSKAEKRAEKQHAGNLSRYIQTLVENDLASELSDNTSLIAVSARGIISDLATDYCGSAIGEELSDMVIDTGINQGILLKQILDALHEFLKAGGHFHPITDDESLVRLHIANATNIPLEPLLRDAQLYNQYELTYYKYVAKDKEGTRIREEREAKFQALLKILEEFLTSSEENLWYADTSSGRTVIRKRSPAPTGASLSVDHVLWSLEPNKVTTDDKTASKAEASDSALKERNSDINAAADKANANAQKQWLGKSNESKAKKP